MSGGEEAIMATRVEGSPRIGFLMSLVDRSNPMLVRVVRQELRNRAFISIFLLLLAGAAIAAMVVAAVTSERSSGDVSRGLFGTIAFGWAFALWLAQPMGCFRAISTERGDDTWDLLELTGLRPMRVIGGLLLASLVQSALYTSALAPFMVMAYLLRGIDLMTVLFALVVVPLGGIAASALAVFAACLGPNKASRAVLGGLLGLSLVGTWLGSAGLWFNLSEMNYYLGELRSGDADAWLGTVAALNAWLGALALLLVLSGALLAFRAANRSTGPRLVWWILWLNAWCWTLAPFFASHFDLDDWWTVQTIFACVGVGAAGVLGLFSTTEDIELSPRQARSITGARTRWRRLAMLLLGPGAARGRLCWLAMGIVSLAIGVTGWLALGMPTQRQYMPVRDILLGAWTAFAWLAIVFTVADLLYRGWMADWFPTPGLRRGFTLLVLALWSLLPPLGMWIVGIDQQATGLGAFSPISALVLVGQGVDEVFGVYVVFSLLGAAAILVQLVQGLRLRIVTQRVQARDEDRNPRGG